MYFIFWHDWDGDYVEEFKEKADAEAKVTEIEAVVSGPMDDRNGTCITNIIKGDRFRHRTVQVASKCVIVEGGEDEGEG